MTVLCDWRESPAKFNDSNVFRFEANFNANDTIEWMARHRHEAFYYIGLYLLFIFYGQQYMKNRPRLEIRKAFVVWNIMLATFSIIGLCRMVPGTMFALKNFDITHLACNVVFDRPSAFWGWLFVLSKALELADTVFIVFRKQQLIFLHWYHHITVLLFIWYGYSVYMAPARWFIVMNYLAHSLMYPYYALRAMRVAVPSIIAMVITSIQVLQMLNGFYICYVVYTALNEGQFCYCPKYLAICGMLMYFSYLALFLRFFFKKYLTPKIKEVKYE